MSDINNDEFNNMERETTPLLTREDVANIIKEFEKQKDEQRENSYRGKDLPERIREILDETPTSDLKDDIKRFKRCIPKYNHGEWTSTPQINKEFTNDLKRWKVDSHQVVTATSRHADEARVQARTSTEIYELLESIKEKYIFADEGTKQIFMDAMSQAERAAVFGFSHARDLDHEAKELSAKALRLPASLRHLEQEEDARKSNIFDTEFYFQALQTTTPTITEEEDTVTEAMEEDRDLLTDTNMEIFSPEDEVVEHSEPQQPISLPQTTIPTIQQASNKSNTVESHGLNQSESRTIIHYTNITSYHTTNNIITNNTGNHLIPNNNFNTFSTNTSTSDANTPVSQHDTGKLYDTRGWFLTRWPYYKFLEKLEKDYFSSLALTHSRRRIQNSVYHQPSSMENSATSSQPSGATGDETSSGKKFDSRNYREMQESSIFKPIPVKVLHNSRTNKEMSNSRLQEIKSIHSGSALQDGRGTSAERVNRKRRFHPPRIFSKLLRYALEPIRREGIRLVYSGYIKCPIKPVFLPFSTKTPLILLKLGT
ncbi:uncharacterized protein B0P05DRAFT_476690 [Gilbertella persicaria]|uniref:uncharacterized protein n=1 Tax=Gilbertella persicaria TaxID=101096 RepID=UPI00221E716D|nr:uncharacterized protein B0P05DRAFT_476690 [Gilbertella persicaria]KAI8063738.1 hypothetical protein B0P05DRAFT_476690 [Gilbertella persicaria]